MKIYYPHMVIRCHEDAVRDLRVFQAEFAEGMVAKADDREVFCATFDWDEVRGLDAELIPGFAIPYTTRPEAMGGTRVYLLSHLQKDWLRWPTQRVMTALESHDLPGLTRLMTGAAS